MTDAAAALAAARRVVDGAGFSGVVHVRCGDETAAFSAGLADRSHGVASSVDTRFGIASGTKGLTALALLRLVDNGLLALDDRVRPFLRDDLPAIDDTVTVRQLLAHRSGIGDYLDESLERDIADHVMTVPVHELDRTEAYLRVLDGHPQQEPPGSAFRYNNSGFVVLALVAERATGRPFPDLIAEVCTAAGMTRTELVRTDELPGDVARGYLAVDGLRTNVLHLPVLGSGDGGVVSTVGDIDRLWRALFDGRIVSTDLRRQMTSPTSDAPRESMRYGLGCWIHASRDDIAALEGMDAGVSFRTVHVPTYGITHTTISNTSSGAWPVTRALDGALGLS